MKKQSWNLRSTRKGYVLSIDIVLAISAVIVLLAVSFYYAHRSSEDNLARLQITRTGSDILAVLDYDGDLDTLNQNTIRNAMNRLLPTNYNMKIEVTPDAGDSFVVGDQLPTKRFISSGKRVFVVESDEEITNYGIAQFWIWLK